MLEEMSKYDISFKYLYPEPQRTDAGVYNSICRPVLPVVKKWPLWCLVSHPTFMVSTILKFLYRWVWQLYSTRTIPFSVSFTLPAPSFPHPLPTWGRKWPYIIIWRKVLKTLGKSSRHNICIRLEIIILSWNTSVVVVKSQQVSHALSAMTWASK